MKRSKLLWMCAVLILGIGMSGCSKDDEVGNELPTRGDEVDNEPTALDDEVDNGLTALGGEVYDGWGKPEVDESDPLAVFFRDELHGPYWDGAGNEFKTFFEHGSWDEEGCLVINSRQEFQDAYMGTKELPEVDFSKYTLLIGKTWGGDSSYKLDDVILRDMTDFYELETRLLHHVDWGAYCAIVDIYYWRLYPKLQEKDIVLKRTVKDVKD